MRPGVGPHPIPRPRPLVLEPHDRAVGLSDAFHQGADATLRKLGYRPAVVIDEQRRRPVRRRGHPVHREGRVHAAIPLDPARAREHRGHRPVQEDRQPARIRLRQNAQIERPVRTDLLGVADQPARRLPRHQPTRPARRLLGRLRNQLRQCLGRQHRKRIGAHPPRLAMRDEQHRTGDPDHHVAAGDNLDLPIHQRNRPPG